MDVLTDSSLTLIVKTSEPENANVAESTGVCEQSGDLSLCGMVDAALPPSSPPSCRRDVTAGRPHTPKDHACIANPLPAPRL
ncbi:hypothetical protein OYC64_013299 [Pagothenia borchgrevinki]|uniref:Uncharacterized protein n=1 Tax=Pagothenia borchgrevinki TaxID=8213 RepID=A0ABD2FTM5_PAGBO